MAREKTNFYTKPLEEMNVIDDFLFSQIMSDEKTGLEVCRMILETVLFRKVGTINYTAQKYIPGVSGRLHGIILDAYVTETDDSGEANKNGIKVYDIEPDKNKSKKEELPYRSRYYGDLIDAQILEPGVSYKNLPELVTIFILSYDPFGFNAMYYEAGTSMITHPDLDYNDGIRRIFLYVDGNLPEKASAEEKRLQNLLKYINRSIEENVSDETTRRLNEIVKLKKSGKETRDEYMKSWEKEQELREEGREEGLKEGREEGLKEGREEERENTLREKSRADAAEARVKELEAMLAAR